MSTGYIFVLSNPLYTEHVLVGASIKTPTERAAELYTEGLLYPFSVVCAKSVTNIETKLVSLHKIMGKFGERPNPDKDFFKIHPELIDNLFDLVDGEMWIPPSDGVSDSSWIEKLTTIIRNENPRANEFQLNKLKMKVVSILKVRGDVELTLEAVREASEIARREIPYAPV
jgi:hypothetical protein